MRSALFWDITQRIVVIPYQRFGRNCRSNLQESRDQSRWNPLTLESGSDSLSQNVGEELPLHPA